MTTSSLAYARSRRRRRRLTVLLTIAAVVAAVAFAVRYRTEERQTAEYLALADEVARGEAMVAESLQGMFAGLRDLDRDDILDLVERMRTQSEALDQQVLEAEVTTEAAALHGYLGVATSSWRTGLAALDDTVIRAVDAEESVDLTEMVRGAAVDLAVGDAAYARFLAEIAALGDDFDPPAFPDVAFVSGVPTDVELLIQRLVALPDLDERRDVAVTVNTDPEPTGSAGSALTMPFAETLDVTAVVTNVGNVDAEEVTVELTMEGEGVEPFTELRIIPSLEAGAAETIEVPDIPIQAGTVYTLTVAASIEKDQSTDDNLWQVVFATNPE